MSTTVDSGGSAAAESPEMAPASPAPKQAFGVGTLLLLGLAAAAVLLGTPLLLRRFVIEAFQIPSGAMIPTLLVGDKILCSKWPRPTKRGDIVVFRYPPDPSVDYIKRVVALAGDELRISKEGLIINGQPVPRREIGDRCPDGMEDSGLCDEWEETLDGHAFRILEQSSRRRDFGPFVVPEGHVFMMGDNRGNSSDSRVWGPVPVANIKGRPIALWWSVGREGFRWNRVGGAPP